MPREVHGELVGKRPDAEGVEQLRSAEWIVVVDAPASIPVDERALAALDAVLEPFVTTTTTSTTTSTTTTTTTSTSTITSTSTSTSTTETP